MNNVAQSNLQSSNTVEVALGSVANSIETSSDSCARVTLISAIKPSVLTKQLSLSKDGELIKKPSAQLYEGLAEVKGLNTLQDFSKLLETLKPNQAIVYGVPKSGESSGKLVTKNRYEALSDKKGILTRTNDHFDWPNGSGIMMFDYDPEEDEALSKEDLLSLLYAVCPTIKDTDLLWWVSSSSNIMNSQTGEQITGVRGQRIYIMVNDASDITRAAKVIEGKLWLQGKGFVKVTRSGAMLERCSFDMSVYQPSRLDFAAGAKCIEPLKQNRGKPELIEGSQRTLDTLSVLPDLSDAELQQVESIKIGKHASASREAQSLKAAYIEKMKDRLLKSDSEVDDSKRSALMKIVLDERKLLPNWVLYLWNNDSIEAITVAELLKNKHYYNGMLCLDPIEPEYDGKRLVGKLYLNQSKPCVFSYARGECSYPLLNKIKTISLGDGDLHDAVNETLEVIRERNELFSYGKALVEPINDSLNAMYRPQMKHYLGGIIDYVGARGKIINPTNDLVDGVIAIGGLRGINPIKGYIDHPMIDKGLRLITTPGYDTQTQLLMAFDKNDFSITDHKLSDDEVLAKLENIYAPFVSFEVASGADKSVLLAAIFSAVVRQGIKTCPAFGFDAPMQGSGKTLLAETIGMLAANKSPSALASQPKNKDDDFRKRLFSTLLQGDKVCLFDNLVGSFDSASFAAALTSEYFEDRVLGVSKTDKVLVKTLFLITGNNLNITGDMSRRVLMMRLAPKSDNLTQRKYDFDPLVKVADLRFEIISDVLSLINHWNHCGAHKASGTMTSFGEWDLLVRQPLAYFAEQYPQLQLHDVLTVSVNQQAASSDKESLVALLIALAREFKIDEDFKAGEALQALKTNDELSDAVYSFIDKNRLQSSQHLGNLLKQYVDRSLEGLVLRSKHVANSRSYRIELLDDTHLKTIENVKFTQSIKTKSSTLGNFRVAG